MASKASKTRKTKFLVIGLSTFGLFFTMHAHAFNIINISNQNQSKLHLEPVNTINTNSIPRGVLNTVNTDNTDSNITFENKKYTLRLIKQEIDSRGVKHSRYIQVYNGVPVWGRQLIQREKTTGKSLLASAGVKNNLYGQLVTNLNQDLVKVKSVSGFSEQDALGLAKLLYKKQHNIDENQKLIYENEKSDLIIYTYSEDGIAKFAYNVSFFVDDADGNQPARPSYLIDPETKQVIKSWNKLTHAKVGTGPGGNEKIGKYFYGTDRPKLDIREAQHNECFLTNSKVRTVDLKNGYFGLKTHHFSCYDSNQDAINGAYSPMNDAHYYGEKIYDMYNEWYQQAPLNFKLVMRVHYGKNYENAFWNGSSMTFGDGRDYFYPLVALDVAAHEISHGFTEQNSNLEYDAQSGGLNESFSDMASKAIEFYAYGKNDWTLGGEVTKDNEPLRYLDTPEKDGRSISDVRDYTSYLDVHYTSGVFNKAFYLLSTYENWTIKKAFDVFVHANKYYWTPNSTFNEAALGAINSADDLGYKVEDVIDIFKQVGMGCSIDVCKNLPDDRVKKDVNDDIDEDSDDVFKTDEDE